MLISCAVTAELICFCFRRQKPGFLLTWLICNCTWGGGGGWGGGEGLVLRFVHPTQQIFSYVGIEPSLPGY